MPFLTSLKRALTVNFLLVASVPVLVFGLLNIQLLSKQQLEGVRERNMLQAKSVSEDVEAFLLEVRSDLYLVEQTIASGKILKTADIDDFLSGVVRNSQFFESIYLLDSGHKILHFGVLPKLQSKRDDYAGLDFSGHQLFQSAEEMTGPVWSNTFVSLVTGEPSVTLGMPMKQGFLLGNIHLSSLGKLLQRYSTYGGVDVSIIDKNGTLVAHNVTEMAMQRVNFGDHPAVIAAMSGQETTQEFKQGSKDYLESVARITTPEWMVWVGLNMNEVMAPILHLRDLLIGFMAATVVLACIVSLFNVRRLMQPLNALGERTGQIADGHYEFNFHPSGFSELDTLTDQIAHMSQAIKVREESIVSNEQRFRDLVNSIDGIVWEMEYPSFRFLFVSLQAEIILGYPVQDWYEKPSFWEEKTHAEDQAQAKAYCRLMSEKHLDHDFEYRMVAVNGKIVWIRDLVTVIVENNRPVRLLGVMIDVTDRKAAEGELEKYRTDLEELVAERTAQLQAAQEELVQKGRLAVLGQLTATVSHEIRNPLGTVANSLYLLKNSLSGEEHAHLARPLMLAERNVERCDNIISDLLDFSRQRKIKKEPLDIDAWFAELLGELSFPDDVQRHLDLTSQTTVLADSERLRRVMVNVITNALQALDEVPNTDKILDIQSRIANDRCEILVFDNGPGMGEEVMARIFEPMFSTKNFGVGLGVPIIKNIMEGHGGGVDYHSELGKGTTVSMWLPLESKIPS